MALARDLALGLDPVLLAAEAGLDPDPWQRDVLRSAAPRMLLNASRQSGKSTTVAMLTLHTAIYQSGSLCLMLSPTLRQSGELFRKVKGLYSALPERQRLPEETALSLRLDNGSRVVSLPGQESTVRGYSAVSLLCIDEASRVPDELYIATRPMLAVSGGRLVALSTPFGTRGWWYEAWRSEDPWERYEVPATECPRISREFLDEEERTMGRFWFDQEYGCTFLDALSQAFTRDEVDRAFQEEVQTWAL